MSIFIFYLLPFRISLLQHIDWAGWYSFPCTHTHTHTDTHICSHTVKSLFSFTAFPSTLPLRFLLSFFHFLFLTPISTYPPHTYTSPLSTYSSHSYRIPSSTHLKSLRLSSLLTHSLLFFFLLGCFDPFLPILYFRQHILVTYTHSYSPSHTLTSPPLASSLLCG